MKEVKIRLPENTHRRAKAVCALKGQSLKQFCREAVEEHIKDSRRKLK